MFSTTTAAAKLHCHTQCEFTELLLLGLSSSAWNMTALYTSIIKAAAKLSAHLNMLLAYISSGQATSHNPFNAFYTNAPIYNLSWLIKYYICINLQLGYNKKYCWFQTFSLLPKYEHLISNQVNTFSTHHTPYQFVATQ